MGQYFMAVNLDKKEYVCPWCLGGVAKFWEWCVNPQAGVLPYLLRKSNESGGGDIDPDEVKHAGRWAGDRIVLVGDYDGSKLYDRARKGYKNISIEVAKEFNEFVGHPNLELPAKECTACKAKGDMEKYRKLLIDAGVIPGAPRP